MALKAYDASMKNWSQASVIALKRSSVGSNSHQQLLGSYLGVHTAGRASPVTESCRGDWGQSPMLSKNSISGKVTFRINDVSISLMYFWKPGYLFIIGHNC